MVMSLKNYELRSIEIVLVCGCKVRKRVPPGGPGAFYPCIYGLGHGYTVGWKSWTDLTSGFGKTNPSLERKA